MNQESLLQKRHNIIVRFVWVFKATSPYTYSLSISHTYTEPHKHRSRKQPEKKTASFVNSYHQSELPPHVSVTKHWSYQKRFPESSSHMMALGEHCEKASTSFRFQMCPSFMSSLTLPGHKTNGIDHFDILFGKRNRRPGCPKSLSGFVLIKLYSRTVLELPMSQFC